MSGIAVENGLGSQAEGVKGKLLGGTLAWLRAALGTKAGRQRAAKRPTAATSKPRAFFGPPGSGIAWMVVQRDPYQDYLDSR
jgi:hypothetical protein